MSRKIKLSVGKNNSFIISKVINKIKKLGFPFFLIITFNSKRPNNRQLFCEENTN